MYRALHAAMTLMLYFSYSFLTSSLFIRPPDIVVGGLIFYHGFFLSSFFFLSPDGTQPYLATWFEVSVI